MCPCGVGMGVVCVYLLYLATCLFSPPLFLTRKAGLPEMGGGFAHLDPWVVGGRVEKKGTQTGVRVSVHLYV